MTAAQVPIPNKLIPVFAGKADVRGSYGGRGSGKTRSFALMSAVFGYRWAESGTHGIILCGRQFMNTLDESSLEEIKTAIRSTPFLNDYYEIGEKYVRTKNRLVEYKFTGLDRNIQSVKSKSRILLCWVDEAEYVTDLAWKLLIPTVREEGSEIWVTWNPEIDGSATDTRFRKTEDPMYKVVEMNWRDNPRFTSKLERDRLRDLENKPDEYDWIWEGSYRTYVEGAYLARHIKKAQEERRISTDSHQVSIPEDPMFTVEIDVDIGGTGAKADNFVMWASQTIDQRINFINHYEVQGQTGAAHMAWLRENGYTPDRTVIYLPHDGEQQEKTIDSSYRKLFEDSGYKVEVIPNQGKGAAKQRIEAMRNQFHRMWFDAKCIAGVKALAWYHEKKDEARNVGLGPNHDWSSHSFDAAGMRAVRFKLPKVKQKRDKSPKIRVA
jgi:phage terminase large subunit